MAAIAVAAVASASSIHQGMQAEKLKEQEARGYIDAAHRRRAAASREVSEEARNRDFMYSRALAVAAASGTGTSGQGMVTLFGDLNAEGEYRILSRLWAGENEAEGLLYRAEIARNEGKAARSAGYINAVTSAVSGYVGMGGYSPPPKQFSPSKKFGPSWFFN